eukprot:gene27628-7265_t
MDLSDPETRSSNCLKTIDKNKTDKKQESNKSAPFREELNKILTDAIEEAAMSRGFKGPNFEKLRHTCIAWSVGVTVTQVKRKANDMRKEEERQEAQAQAQAQATQ